MKVQELLDNIQNVMAATVPPTSENSYSYIIIFTEYAIQKLQITIRKFMDDNPEQVLSQEHIAVILNLLREFFEVTRGTRYVAVYDPHSSLTRVLLSIAQLLEPLCNINRYQILMPSINVVDYEASLTSLYDHDLQITDFVLSDDGTSIIEVYNCLSFASEDGVLKHTRLFDGQLKTLNAIESARVINHSVESNKYWKAIQEKVSITMRGDSYGAVLQRLCNDLCRGGASRGGEELNSGADANVGIKNFFDWYNALSMFERFWLRWYRADGLSSSLGGLLDRLARPQSANYRETRYCVEIIAGNIDTILRANQQLFDVRSQNASRVVYQLGIQQATHNVAAAADALKKALAQLNYRVNAYDRDEGSITNRIAFILSYDLHLYVSKKGLQALFSSPKAVAEFMRYMPNGTQNQFIHQDQIRTIINEIQYRNCSDIAFILDTMPYSDRMNGIEIFRDNICNLIERPGELAKVLKSFKSEDTLTVLNVLSMGNLCWFQPRPTILFYFLETIYCYDSGFSPEYITTTHLNLIFNNSNVELFIKALNKPESKGFQSKMHKSLVASVNNPERFSSFILDVPMQCWSIVFEVLHNAIRCDDLLHIDNNDLLAVANFLPNDKKAIFLKSCDTITLGNCWNRSVFNSIIANYNLPKPLENEIDSIVYKIAQMIIKFKRYAFYDNMVSTLAVTASRDKDFLYCLTIMTKFSGLAALKAIPNIEYVAMDAKAIIAEVAHMSRMVEVKQRLSEVEQRTSEVEPIQRQMCYKYYSSAAVEIENRYIRETVATLSPYGLTEEYLRANLRPNTGVFCLEASTIIYLVTGISPKRIFESQRIPALTPEQRLTPAQAIREIMYLNDDQTGALENLWAYGLKSEHLRSFKGARFWYDHKWALEYYIRDRNPPLTPMVAIQRINGLTNEEVSRLWREDQRQQVPESSRSAFYMA